jgi:uncharacterized protein
MRRLLKACGAVLLWASIAFPIDVAALKPEGYVSDFARVLQPDARTALEGYCARLEAQTGAQVALVTLETLDGEPIEDIANTMFRKWGVGRKGKDEGVLLLLVTGDRRMRMEVGYGLEPIIPDGFAGSVLRSMRSGLREQRYGEALAAALQVLGSRITEAKGVSLETKLPRRRTRRAQPVPWPFLLGSLGMLLWVLATSRGRRGGRRMRGSGFDLFLAILVGSMLGRSFGGSMRGGGGFGGFDSGDSFGGFGGGDSGGGGASSSW